MKKLLLCGRNSVEDALKAKLPILQIFANSQRLAQQIQPLTKVNVEIKSNEFLNTLTNNNHQGLVAILKDFPIYDFSVLEKEKPSRILMLDHIQDPQNLGAILRTSNAFGLSYIIIPKDRSADITTTVLKVSSGGFVNSKLIKVSNLGAAITKLKEKGYWIYSSVLNEKAKPYNKANYNLPMILVLGNEENGVSNSLIKMSDELIYIPQKGTVQSLNVSVAAGILINEITKE